MSKLKLATVWLDGCSGCHMSFLDLDVAVRPGRPCFINGQWGFAMPEDRRSRGWYRDPPHHRLST